MFAVLPDEVRETVNLYLDGKIEQWYSLQEKPRVAFITDPAVAHEMLEKLPLGQKHYNELRADPHWSVQPAPLAEGDAAETYLNVMCGR